MNVNEVVKKTHRQFKNFFDTNMDQWHTMLMSMYEPYVKSLSNSDVQLLLFYTYNGDEYMNNYLCDRRLPGVQEIRDIQAAYEDKFSDRNTDFYRMLHTMKQDPERCIKWCILQLMHIINNAPRYNKDLFVLRGTRTFHERMASNVSNRFLSTSIQYHTALVFSGNESTNEERDPMMSCLSGNTDDLDAQFFHYIMVSPNTPMIYMPALEVRQDIGPHIDFGTLQGEREVLFPPGIQIQLIDTVARRGQDGVYEKLTFEEFEYGGSIKITRKLCGIVFERFGPPTPVTAGGGRLAHRNRTRKQKQKRRASRTRQRRR